MTIDLYDAMSTLRAVRKLRPDPIPDSVLERVLQAACWAPTGGNQQPWKVIVVTDPAKKAALREIYRPEWQTYVAGLMQRLDGQPDEVVERWRRVAAAGDHLADHLHETPAILLFCANPDAMAITDRKLDRVSMIGGASVYPAVQNAMLACVAEGLGCTLTTLHCLREPEVKALLDIPDAWATVALVPIGYPVGRGHGPITRKGPERMAARDSFQTPWTRQRPSSDDRSADRTPGETVTAFIEAIERHDVDAAVALTAPDISYENMPIDPVVGHDGLAATLRMFLAPAEEVDWHIVRQVEHGDVVVNERLDRFKIGEGWLELPVAGVFRVDTDGRITLWRDYFDMGAYQRRFAELTAI